MEWVDGALFENKQGQKSLQSIRDGDDDPEFDFFRMTKFWIEEIQPYDVATFALQKIYIVSR